MGDSIGPALPPHLTGCLDKVVKDSQYEDTEQKQSIGPALPPHVAQKNNRVEDVEYGKLESESRKVTRGSIGPTLPPWMRKKKGEEDDEEEEESFGPSLPPAFESRPITGPTMPGNNIPEFTEDSGPIIGPLPPAKNVDIGLSIVEEIEKRSKKMKDRLTGKEEPKKIEREEWMIELPPLLQGFASGPRKFRAREKVIGDRSVWTDTPADRERRAAQGKEAKEISDQDRINIDSWTKRDSEIAQKIANDPKSEKKESLMSIHEKTLKRKAQEAEDSGEANIRRPFDRELDLQTNQFDEATKKRMMKQSQGLSSRFSSGNTTAKFL